MPPLPHELREQGWSPREPAGCGVLLEELAGDPPQGQEPGTPSTQTLWVPPLLLGRQERVPRPRQHRRDEAAHHPCSRSTPKCPREQSTQPLGPIPGHPDRRRQNTPTPPLLLSWWPNTQTIPLDTLTTFRAHSVAFHTVTPVCGHDLCAVPGRSRCPTQRCCARWQSLPWLRLLRFLPTSTGKLAPHASHTWSHPHAAFCGWPPSPEGCRQGSPHRSLCLRFIPLYG